MKNGKPKRRRGVYVPEQPALKAEIADVAARVGIPAADIVAILLRPYEGRVAEHVSRYVVEQLGLFPREELTP